MGLSLNKPSAGDVGWAASVNQNWTDIENAVRLPTRYIEGLLVRYESATEVVVSPGSCRNAANADDIALDTETTAAVATGHDSSGLAQLNGLDEKGLDNLSTGSITCSQTGVLITATGDVTAHYGTRAGTGQITTSDTSVTGTGTKFLNEVSVLDLVGTSSTHGWGQVAAVNSDTSLTILPLPGGDISTAKNFTIVHNAMIQPDKEGTPTPGTASGVNSITSDGKTIKVPVSATHSSGTSLTIGVELAGVWYAIWVIDDGSTPGLLLSTQRETLLAPPSGYTSARRIGWIRNNGSGDLEKTLQLPSGWGRSVTVQRRGLLSGGSATSWTDVALGAYAPPSSKAVVVEVANYKPTTYADAYVKLRSRDATINSAEFLLWNLGDTGIPNTTSTMMQVPCDGAQYVQYVLANADYGQRAYITILGYIEEL